MITMRNGQERSVGGNEWRPLKTSWKDAYFKKYRLIRSLGKHSCIPAETVTFVLYRKNFTGKTCRELVQERVEKGDRSGQTFHGCSARKVSARGNGAFTLTTGDMLESDCFT